MLTKQLMQIHGVVFGVYSFTVVRGYFKLVYVLLISL